MVTSTSPLARQPTKLDYASPTQFTFGIHQLPKVEFFVTAVNLPGLSLPQASMATPFKDIPVMGEKLEYSNLSITFLVDEYLENYISLHNWITGAGFPQKRDQFSTFRDVTSNTQIRAGSTPSVDIVGTTTPDRTMYSDAYIMILSNKNNPILQVNFQDIFPVSLGDLDFTQASTDVEYMSVTAEFAYKIYDIETL